MVSRVWGLGLGKRYTAPSRTQLHTNNGQEMEYPTADLEAVRRNHSSTQDGRKRVVRWRLSQPNPHLVRPNLSDDDESSAESALAEELEQGFTTEDSSPKLSSPSITSQPLLSKSWDDYLMKGRNALRRAAESESARSSASEDESFETASESGESSAESLRLETPMVRFLLSDSDDSSSQSAESSTQDVSLEGNDESSEENESLESWSDPEETLATIGENVALAVNLF